MNSSGFNLPKGTSVAFNFRAELDSPSHHGLSIKPGCVFDLGSQWNISGALNFDLQIHVKDNTPSSSHLKYKKSLTCSSHLSEKVPSIFPVKLSSYVKEWIGQIFSSENQGHGSKPGNEIGEDVQASRFRSFLLEYDNNGALPTFTMKPLEHNKGSLSPYEDPKTHVLNAETMGERPLVSDTPSARALESATFFDVLQNNLSQEAKLAELFTYDLCPKKRERDDLETMNRFRSPDALASWLNDRLPSGVSHWGTAPGTKRVANLWMELIEGEIVLEDAHPPRRTVHVASVHIKNDAGHVLVEAHQEMADGSIRHRNRPLSEKMRPGEDVETACFRGISEELGCQLGCKSRVKIVPDSYRQKLEERESLSYPGLLTSYIIHSIDVTIKDLPDTGFYTVEDEMASKQIDETPPLSLLSSVVSPNGADGKNNNIAVGVKKHFWRWVPQHL